MYYPLELKTDRMGMPLITGGSIEKFRGPGTVDSMGSTLWLVHSPEVAEPLISRIGVVLGAGEIVARRSLRTEVPRGSLADFESLAGVAVIDSLVIERSTPRTSVPRGGSARAAVCQHAGIDAHRVRRGDLDKELEPYEWLPDFERPFSFMHLHLKASIKDGYEAKVEVVLPETE